MLRKKRQDLGRGTHALEAVVALDAGGDGRDAAVHRGAGRTRLPQDVNHRLPRRRGRHHSNHVQSGTASRRRGLRTHPTPAVPTRLPGDVLLIHCLPASTRLHAIFVLRSDIAPINKPTSSAATSPAVPRHSVGRARGSGSAAGGGSHVQLEGNAVPVGKQAPRRMPTLALVGRAARATSRRSAAARSGPGARGRERSCVLNVGVGGEAREPKSVHDAVQSLLHLHLEVPKARLVHRRESLRVECDRLANQVLRQLHHFARVVPARHAVRTCVCPRLTARARARARRARGASRSGETSASEPIAGGGVRAAKREGSEGGLRRGQRGAEAGRRGPQDPERSGYGVVVQGPGSAVVGAGRGREKTRESRREGNVLGRGRRSSARPPLGHRGGRLPGAEDSALSVQIHGRGREPAQALFGGVVLGARHRERRLSVGRLPRRPRPARHEQRRGRAAHAQRRR